MEKQGKERLYWIDAARGLAALGVAIMHMLEHARHLYPSADVIKKGSILGFFIIDFVNLGKVGVVVFFFISGFVIPFSLHGKNLRQFAVSRFFRLYPAYWASIGLSVLFFGVPPLTKLFANLTMFQGFVGIGDMVGVYWTLQIELVFYFICGLLFYFGRLFDSDTLKKGLYVFLFVSIVLSLVRYITDIKLPIALPLSLSVMFLGMLLRDATVNSDKRIIRQLFLLFLVSLLIVCFFAYNKDYGFSERWDKYFASYMLGFVIFLGFRKWNGHNKLLVFLGKISYSLYLLHPVAGFFLSDIVRESLWPDITIGAYAIVFVLSSLISATLCFYFIEKPAVKLGRIFAKRKVKVLISNPYKS